MASPGVYAFEAIDDALPFMPLAARRALDLLGRKLSLEAWLSLAVDERRRIIAAGTQELVDANANALVDRAIPSAPKIPPQSEPAGDSAPPDLAHALGTARALDDARWRGLTPLDRYALVRCASKPEKLARAYDEIVRRHARGFAAASSATGNADDEPGPLRTRLAHLTAAGEAHMVDVGEKRPSARRAVASARVRTTRAVVEAIAAGATAKGDVFAVARVAGLLAAKRTPELIPLCHPVQTTRAAIDFEAHAERGELRVFATVEAVDRTGVEMEAMMAASIASLAVYDMIKSADRWATIDEVRLDSKSGGKSGQVERPPERGGR
jgi:cyclic pyranopterin phosphate synthase